MVWNVHISWLGTCWFQRPILRDSPISYGQTLGLLRANSGLWSAGSIHHGKLFVSSRSQHLWRIWDWVLRSKHLRHCLERTVWFHQQSWALGSVLTRISPAQKCYKKFQIPSGNQKWLAGKSLINGGFNRNISYKWSIFHCHVWLPDDIYSETIHFRSWRLRCLLWAKPWRRSRRYRCRSKLGKPEGQMKDEQLWYDGLW